MLQQLRDVGFDPEAIVSNMSTIHDTQKPSSYAAVTATEPNKMFSSGEPRTKQERQEEKFSTCRRSLRHLRVLNAMRSSLNEYLVKRLGLDQAFIWENVGEVTIRRHIERKKKNYQKACITFDNKQVHDYILGHAANLANHRDEAVMKLHVPDHLQKDFRALMNLVFDLKKIMLDLTGKSNLMRMH